jgi:hypothetical protein
VFERIERRMPPHRIDSSIDASCQLHCSKPKVCEYVTFSSLITNSNRQTSSLLTATTAFRDRPNKPLSFRISSLTPWTCENGFWEREFESSLALAWLETASFFNLFWETLFELIAHTTFPINAQFDVFDKTLGSVSFTFDSTVCKLESPGFATHLWIIVP